MTIYHKGEAWPEQRYVEPTKAEVDERREYLQTRCPFDLTEVHLWSREMLVDWGFQLKEIGPGRDGQFTNMEGLALFAAGIRMRDVRDWQERWDKLINSKVEEVQNEPATTS